MTGSVSDPASNQPHLHRKEVRRELKARAKNPNDREMWLTGFDAPSLHTFTSTSPCTPVSCRRSRVSRTFRDKPGGLIVD